MASRSRCSVSINSAQGSSSRERGVEVGAGVEHGLGVGEQPGGAHGQQIRGAGPGPDERTARSSSIDPQCRRADHEFAVSVAVLRWSGDDELRLEDDIGRAGWSLDKHLDGEIEVLCDLGCVLMDGGQVDPRVVRQQAVVVADQ